MVKLPQELIIIRGPVGAGKSSVVKELRKRISASSIVDFDSFKRQIDNSESSSWRRDIAIDTALFMTERVMHQKRAVIIDIHSSQINLLQRYVQLANNMQYKVTSFLIYPPLEVCLERAAKRIVPDINYQIDIEMINRYWSETVFIDGEMQFTDTSLSAADIAESIVDAISARRTKNSEHIRQP